MSEGYNGIQINPRPYQKESLQNLWRVWRKVTKKTGKICRKALLVLPTGTGKTMVFSILTNHAVKNEGSNVLILAHRDELIRQAADKLHVSTGLQCAIEKADETGHDSFYKVVVASVQTLSIPKRLNRYRPDHFDYIIVDETHRCHPWYTKIDGRYISSLVVGDAVRGYDHEAQEVVIRRISAVMSREASSVCAITLIDGRVIVATPDHPIWDGEKYVYFSVTSRKDAVYERKTKTQVRDMCNLRKGVHSDKQKFDEDSVLLQGACTGRNKKEKEEKESEVPVVRKGVCLRGKRPSPAEEWKDILLKRMFKCIQRLCVKSSAVGIQPGSRIRSHEKEQPDDEYRNRREDAEVKERKNIPVERRHGSDNKTATGFVRRAWSWILHGVFFIHKWSETRNRFPSEPLLAGYSGGRDEAGHRDRRPIAQNEKAEMGRQKESEGLRGIRVAHVALYKRGRDPEFERLCPDGRVYNIEVEGTHNYFAEGILVHNCLAKTYQRILNHFPDAKVLGVTATAMRGDKQSLGKFFEEIAHEYRLGDAINDGWLTPIEAETCPVEIDISEVAVNAGEYSAAQVDCAITPHLEAVADQLMEKARERKTLLFLPLVATSKAMAQILTARGIECRSVDGKMSKQERADTLEWYRNAPRGSALCNSMLLTEGFDQPDIDCLVVLRATKSSGLYRQMIGRGTRVLDEAINQEGLTADQRKAIIAASAKKNMLILDFLWLTSHHRLCSPATLVAMTEETEEVVRERQGTAGRVSLDELEGMALTCEQEKREEALAANMEGLKGRKAAKINPVIEALSLFDDKIIVWEPRNEYEMRPSMPSQREALSAMGFKGSEEWSAGFAHKILGTIKVRNEAGLCTPKQLKILVKYGVPKAQDKTKDQASAIIDGLSKSWNKGRARRR